METVVLSGVFSLLSAALVGIVSLRLQRSTNLAQDRRERFRLDQEKALQHRLRLYERRADTYVAFLTALHRGRQIVQRTLPIVGPAPDPPAPLTDDEATLLQARIAAFGSREMRELLKPWSDLQSEIAMLVREYGLLSDERAAIREEAQARGVSFREASGGRTSHDVLRDLEEKRGRLTQLLSEIESQVAVELQQPGPGPLGMW